MLQELAGVENYGDLCEGKPKEIGPDNIIVFVVDDDRDDRFMAYSALKNSDRVAEVCPVPSADHLFKCFEALGFYDDSFPHDYPALILLDIHMPDMDGIKALDYIRDHPITAHIPVILLTGDVSGDKVYDAYQREVNGYLHKPLMLDQFHEEIDSGCHWTTS